MPRIRVAAKKPPEMSNVQESELDEMDSNIHIDFDGSSTEDDISAPVVVKMKLNSFCPNIYIQKRLSSLVLDSNRLLGEAYTFAEFHILRLFDIQQTLIPNINRQYFYRCLLAVSQTNARKDTLGPDFEESVRQFDELRTADSVTKVDMKLYGQLLSDLSLIMETMGYNHIWTNIKPRLLRFIKWMYPFIKKKHTYNIIDALLYSPTKDLNILFKDPKDPKMPTKNKAAISKANAKIESNAKIRATNQVLKIVVMELRSIMPLPRKGENKGNAAIVMRMLIHILRETENAKKLYDQNKMQDKASCSTSITTKAKKTRAFQGRTFTLIPAKAGFTISHIPISNMTMLGILRNMKLAEFAWDGRNADHDAIWRKHFNLKLVETRNKHFGYRIVTDGYAVSVVMQKKCCMLCSKKDHIPEELQDLYSQRDNDKHIRFVGVDPGGTDIVTTAILDDDNVGKCETYSSKKYYNKALFDTSRHRTTAWNNETTDMIRTIPDKETASLEIYKMYVKAYIAVLPGLLMHRAKKGYRNMRFLRFIHKKKVIDDICTMIAPMDKFTVVGFGDWKGFGSSPISRRCSGPLQEIKMHLQGRNNVRMLSIWEYRTSKCCNCCFQELTNMKASQTKFKKIKDENGVWSPNRVPVTSVAKIHKVLHCRSRQNDLNNGTVPSNGVTDAVAPKRCGTTWNRDINAAKNILMLMILEILEKPRPFEFCRQEKAV